MKKALSLLLALVMCLSLCACGGNNTTVKQEIPTETVAPLMVEAPYEIVVPFMTEASTLTYKTVEITKDNWREYFEFRLGDGSWHEDAFGDATRYSSFVEFAIKEEYLDIVNPDTIDIIFSYSFAKQYWYYEIDFERKILTVGEKVPNELLDSSKFMEGVSNGISMTSTAQGTSYVWCEKGYPSDLDINGTGIIKIDAVDIDRIQGTIEIQIN